MPRYFFHLHCGETVVSDSAGVEFQDPDQAWEAARSSARDLMKTKIESDVDLLTCHWEVVDGTGEVVLEFPFREAVETSRQPN